MSLKKFKTNDIILNTMKTHPECEFFVFDGVVYYNNSPHPHSGAFSANVLNVSPGFISLYEYNVDKSEDINPFIYPYITKDSSGGSFKSAVCSQKNGVIADNEWLVAEGGDFLYGTYPQTASITRELLGQPTGSATAGTRAEMYTTGTDADGATTSVPTTVNGVQIYSEPTYRHYWSLRNRLNNYEYMSPHFAITGSLVGPNATGSWWDPASPMRDGVEVSWIKDQQIINLISIPSIFYGSTIKPGTVSLKWYLTGSLIGELQDIKHNGELIQVSTGSVYDPNIANNSASVAGVVMYNEGFILLTGSWALNSTQIPLVKDDTNNYSPSWRYFGAGTQDGVTQATTATTFNSASFSLSFKGTTETQVMTMFANAKRGEVNYSNNPTFLEYGQDVLNKTSSVVYEENSSRLIKNTVSSSYTDYSASFKRQVYVSRVAIYDESRNLIGLATLSNPVLKEEDQDFTFKIRLDM